MSYDLYLYRREPAGPLGEEGFRSYFERYPNFTLEGTRAGYANEKTGVYFTIGYSDGDTEDGDAPNAGREHIFFNMNYYRPHVFGLEAERVLTRLVKKLDLVVSDPQSEGMGDGEYTPEGFLRGWNAGNRYAHEAFKSLGARGERTLGRQHTLPAEKLRACWKWTYGIDALYDDVHADDIDVFIPRVMYVLCDGVLQTVCVWPQLIPTALPAVDRVLVTRDQLPEEFADGVDKAKALVTWQQVRDAAAGFEVKPGTVTGLPYILMDHGTAEEAPDELVEFVRGLPAFDGELKSIELDQILDEELVRESSSGEA